MLTLEDVFDAQLYGAPSQESVNQFREATQRVAQFIPNHFKHVHQRVVERVDKLADFDYQHAMRVAAAHVASAWEGDHIRHLRTVEDLQAAAPVNIRWNMAEPTYRALYQQGQANGYGEDYNDTQPDAIGNNHIDYKRVTHGQWIEDDDECTMVMYDSDVTHDEAEEDILILSQQRTIQSNWLKIREETLRKGLDIGCPMGGSL